MNEFFLAFDSTYLYDGLSSSQMNVYHQKPNLNAGCLMDAMVIQQVQA